MELFFFKKDKYMYFILTSIYVFINSLFIYKYAIRQEAIPVFFALICYIIYSYFFFFKFRKNIFSKLKEKEILNLFWTLSAVFFFLFILIVYYIDGYSLNIDRWSALELTVQCLTEGKYPYTRLDHLNQMTSNFPALGFLALPFYLLGDVGYLQVFTFALFVFYLFKTSKTSKTALLTLFLFISSPALLWEVYAKSDLVNNLMLLYLFFDFFIFKNNKIKLPFLFGFGISFFLLTRGIVIIPIIIFFFKDFITSSWNIKLKVIISVIITLIILILPTIIAAPDLNTIINYNPLILQTNKARTGSYIFIALAFIIPFITTKRKDHYLYSSIIIFSVPFTTFLFASYKHGLHETIVNTLSDITYMSMCLPSILIWFKIYFNNVINIE